MFIDDLIAYCKEETDLNTYFQTDISSDCVILKLEGLEQSQVEYCDEFYITFVYAKSGLFTEIYPEIKSFFHKLQQLNASPVGDSTVSAIDMSQIEVVEQGGRWIGYQTFLLIKRYSDES